MIQFHLRITTIAIIATIPTLSRSRSVADVQSLSSRIRVTRGKRMDIPSAV